MKNAQGPVGRNSKRTAHRASSRQQPNSAGTRRATKLETAFSEVRRAFFPQWDRKRLWKIRQMPKNGAPRVDGQCDSTNKLITIAGRKIDEGGDDLALVLIHEICHAVTRGRHGGQFRERVFSAARRATALGRTALAAKLDQHAHTYTDDYAGVLTLYHELDAFVMRKPGASINDFERHLGLPTCARSTLPTTRKAGTGAAALRVIGETLNLMTQRCSQAAGPALGV